MLSLFKKYSISLPELYLYDGPLWLSLSLYKAALGLRCCARAFSSCGEWGLLFIAVPGLLTAVAYLVVEHGL